MSQRFWLVGDNNKKTVNLNAAARSTFRAAAVQIHMYAVKSGEAIVISRGGSVVLVDGGSGSGRDRNDVPAQRLINRLDPASVHAVIASHPHRDHTNFHSLLCLSDRMAPGAQYFDNATEPAKRNWGRLTALPGPVAFRHRPVGRNLSRDQEDRVRGVFGNSAELLVLRDKTKSMTEAGQKYWSVFLLLRFGDASMLFTGDVLASYEKNIAPRIQNIVPRVHILKITHHGAESGTCEQFVRATLPAIAISSSDSDEGHKLEPEVRDRLKQIANSAIYTTFDANQRRDVVVRTDGVTRTIAGFTGVVFEMITLQPAIFN